MSRLMWRVCLVQAAGLAGLTVYIVVRSFGNDIQDQPLLLLAAVFTLLLSVLLAIGERALEAGRRWPIVPVSMTELLAALIAVDMIDGHVYFYATLVGLPSVIALIGLTDPIGRRGRISRL